MASLTVYDDVIVPQSLIAAGVTGRQIRRNTRVQAPNGRMRINVDQPLTLRQYEFGLVPLDLDQWATIEGLFEVTDAGAYGMLLSDPKDAAATLVAGRVSLVSGTTYQLQKRYTAAGSSRTKDRKITRPLASGFLLQESAVTVPPANYTLNVATGTLTIASAPVAATLTWSGSFYVPVHFRDDNIDWDLARAGPYDKRLIAGPNVVLDEVLE